MAHSGNEVGVVKSLRVEVIEVEERVSAKKVVKHGAVVKIVFKSKPISRNSPCSKLCVAPRCLSTKLQGAATFWSGTMPHKSLLPLIGLHSPISAPGIVVTCTAAPDCHL